MFGPWIETYVFLKGLVPTVAGFRKLKKPKFNFIMIHYMYIIGMTLLGSIIIYGDGQIPYIDALFFGSGASTQSGLNTIDVNLLKTYQQVTLMMISCVANPIFINTFVTFVRLYWFEKRFQRIVMEARSMRRTKTKASIRSRTKSQGRDGELDIEEKGVGGNQIVVMRPSRQTMHAAHEVINEEDGKPDPGSTDQTITGSDDDNGGESGSSGHKSHWENAVLDSPVDRRPGAENEMESMHHREITFADEVPQPKRRLSSTERVPQLRSADYHVAFLENQRRMDEDKEDDVLYIPNPREFEQGYKPSKKRKASFGDGAPLSTKRSREPHPSLSRLAMNSDPNLASKDADVSSPIARLKDRVFSGFSPHGRSKTTDFQSEEKPESLRHRGRKSTFTSFLSSSRTEERDRDPMPYLSWEPTVGRNSAFVNLSEDQREELGGIEYRALKTLAAILCIYYVGFHVLGMINLVPWIEGTLQWKQVVVEDGVDPGWWGVFTAASLFTDLGLTLTPDSMISFQYAIWPLLLGSFLIIIGNTGFPCMLRFVIWVAAKFTRYGSALSEELRFLLDHPRRCFTLLFPGKATWWLFWVLVLLNGIDLIFFIILDLNDPTVSGLSPGIRVLDGWFQAAATRTAGFSVVNLADLHPGIQVSYLIMMYISVFPIAISVRRTNVYEERSLGVYTSPFEKEDEPEQSYVGSHLRRQLSFDLWYIFLGLFIICIVEGSRIENTKDTAFTIFSVLFEIVSAYGTVGLSLGYPGTNASFSAQFKTLSKLVIIAMQIRGRHRGLPYALDRAILLPSENLQKKETEDATMREARRTHTARRNTVTSDDASDEGNRQSKWRVAQGASLTRVISSAFSAGPSKHTRRD